MSSRTACCEKHRRIILFTSTALWMYEKSGYDPINKENYTWALVQSDIYNLYDKL